MAHKMKWFKHMTDSSDDLFVRDLERRFGDAGYAFWFKTLELLGAHGKAGVLTISWKNYCERLNKRRDHLRRILTYCSQDAHLTFVENSEDFVTITCAKFAEIADNFTKYGGKLQSDFKVSLKQEEEGEEDKKKIRREEKKDILPSSGLSVLEHWNSEAKRLGLKTILRLSDKRVKAVAARFAEKELTLRRVSSG